jgi:hypothetical protein
LGDFPHFADGFLIPGAFLRRCSSGTNSRQRRFTFLIQKTNV